MKMATATFQNGRLELNSRVDWPDGTLVEIRPLDSSPQQMQSWLTLPPLDVGKFEEPASDNDLLGEMLDDSRS